MLEGKNFPSWTEFREEKKKKKRIYQERSKNFDWFGQIKSKNRLCKEKEEEGEGEGVVVVGGGGGGGVKSVCSCKLNKC